MQPEAFGLPLSSELSGEDEGTPTTLSPPLTILLPPVAPAYTPTVEIDIHTLAHGEPNGMADPKVAPSSMLSSDIDQPRHYLSGQPMQHGILPKFLDASRRAADITSLKTRLRKADAELRARINREGKLITKILQLEQAIAVIRQQRDEAKSFGLLEHNRANAVHHVFYGTPYPVDALVLAVFQASIEPTLGENLEDLALSDFSDYEDIV